jgi:hypothetical protein
MFFPEPEDRSAVQALAFCASCPVQFECLEDALERKAYEDFGIRGGATSADRRRLRKSRNVKPGPSVSTPQTCLTCDGPVFMTSSERRPDGTWARAVMCCNRGHLQHMTVTLEAV